MAILGRGSGGSGSAGRCRQGAGVCVLIWEQQPTLAFFPVGTRARAVSGPVSTRSCCDLGNVLQGADGLGALDSKAGLVK